MPFEALRQLRQRSLSLANGSLDALEVAFVEIKRTPRLNARLEANESDREIRRVILKRFNYLVIYEVAGDAPLVLAVMHASPQPNLWRERTA